MINTQSLLALAALFFALGHTPVHAAEPAPLTDHVLGNKAAPITVVEYASFTCSHCGVFYNDVLPEIEKRYVDTGKVKFIFRDYPMDAFGLKASSIAHCMPDAQFYPFVKILFKNQASWIHAPKPEETLLQYAQMAGLPADKAKACIEDTKLMDEIIAIRTTAQEKYDINSTPTFLINDGEEKIVGSQSADEFAKSFDKILARKK